MQEVGVANRNNVINYQDVTVKEGISVSFLIRSQSDFILTLIWYYLAFIPRRLDLFNNSREKRASNIEELGIGQASIICTRQK